jgi:hypothetical protein
MQSSEWTPERLQCRIQDHLRWVAAVQNSVEPTPCTTFHFHPWLWFQTAIRSGALAVPFVGPQLHRVLRGVKVRLRRRFFPPPL